MDYIRLKTALNLTQIEDRLQYNPEIIEFHLIEKNLYETDLLIEQIRLLKSKGIRVYLHHPMTYQGRYLDIISSDQNMREHYDWSCEILSSICKQEKIKCVVHCHYALSESTDYHDSQKRMKTRKKIEKILSICGDSFLWENTIHGIFSSENPYLLSEIVEPLNLPLNIDISHSFISLKGDNNKLKEHLDKFHCFANYFHIVDSMGMIHDSLPLGKGKINWEMVKPYVKDSDFIFEIDLKSSNYSDCTPMIQSVNYFKEIESKLSIV
ncbi:TIM barrel protein [Aneurinibacillus tyrosinisolvens]|uniref:TIM barrel protein n=1 Tax=Aneurinibacillus tyrosinisolvens TaxID=1443435 RepID=UPI00063FAB3E|nr:TIM barrel protein [Aneurinibacillus tyrosinisolvens]